MPDDNGRLANIENCIRDLQVKIDSKFDVMLAKIDTLAGVTGSRVEKVESKVQHLAVKVALGVSGAVSLIITLTGWYFGGR